MTQDNDSDGGIGSGINRRSVLKSMGAAGAAGIVGVPAFSGSVAAQTSALPYRFYTVHPFNNIDKLVGFDPVADGSGTVAATEIADLTYNGTNPTFGCYTIGFHPDGDLYGISVEETNHLFKIDTGDGVITKVAEVDITTGASAFSYDGNTLYFYYLNPGDDKLVRVEPDGSNQTEFDLELDASFDGTTSAGEVWEGESVSNYYGEYNSGLAVDFDTGDLFAVIASVEEPPKPNGDDDKVQIGKDGTVSLLQKDVITENRKVGDEIDSCTGTLTAIRAGDDLYELEESDTRATKIGDVKLGDTELDVASLASPWDVCGCSQFDLCAGQDTVVGTVTVSDDGEELSITYEMDPEAGWLLYETHVDIGDCDEDDNGNPDDFHTNKPGNPKVGEFDLSETHDGVTEVTYTVDCDSEAMADVKQGQDELCIAAHAVVKPECPDFSTLDVDESVEGLGTAVPLLNINAEYGEAVAQKEGESPASYGAPTGSSSPSILNGCLSVDDTGGFADLDAKDDKEPQNFTFTFAEEMGEFSVRMLDYGDYNPTRSDHHFVEMVAYDEGDNVIDSQQIEYWSDGAVNPSNSWSNAVKDTPTGWQGLEDAGDACDAEDGEPGNFVWDVSGDGIVEVELRFGAGHDPNIAFSDLCMVADETAWVCEGEDFAGSNWARYFTYDTCSPFDNCSEESDSEEAKGTN